MRVRSHSLVLPVDQDPQSDLIFRVIKMLSDTGLERAISLVLEDAECRQIRGWPVALVETGQVKPFVLVECVVGDYL
jgi:hypothetical protein